MNLKKSINNSHSFYRRISLILFLLSVIHKSFSADFDIKETTVLSPLIDETSGLASHGNFFYTINDSGNSNSIHKLSRDGEILNSIGIRNSENTDWESLAQDEEFLYIADTGNNFNLRNTFIIYRVAWSELNELEAEAELITFSYGDYRPGSMRSHNFDAEAIAIRGEEIWLFSKNRGDGNTKLYRFPKIPGVYKTNPSQSLSVDSLVTGADIDPNTGNLLLTSTRLSSSVRENIIWLVPTNDEGVDWSERQSITISPEDQWEAILWDSLSNEVILTHENNVQGYAGLGRFSVGELVQ